ncbi:CopD family protein [Psychrobacter sp. I-STPA6b]|uniref:CopD family protein n=1 Tax=Psychrobacter sp. I-STPA6b TaxID=2585718 RepID=UPI001D0C05EE|nr:CopD family protein [Psychrobacter sp. I-STPA6b]
MLNFLLIIHLLGASIWVGGHLMLALTVLPPVLIRRDVPALLAFEQRFEKIGMPALLLQIITGIWMAHRFLPNVSQWWTLNNDISKLICLKLGILTMTAIIALHARFRVIPTLSERNLNFFALHIISVTLLSVAFVVVGTIFRTGFS